MADAFEQELEALVTRLSRELAQEITALILRRLGIAGAPGARALGRAVAGRPAASARPRGRRGAGAGKTSEPRKAGGRRIRASAEEREAAMRDVEKALTSSPGLSLGAIEKKTGRSRTAVTAALKALKDQGRMFMGGTRRFARYAASQAAADRASADARKGAAA